MFSFFKRKTAKQGGDGEGAKENETIKLRKNRSSIDSAVVDINGRRNSSTDKEVVNLLLPDDSIKYKKDASYLSKAGVQGLLDRMGRRKKTWSFGAKKRDTIDSDPNVLIKDERLDSLRHLIAEMNEINLKLSSDDIIDSDLVRGDLVGSTPSGADDLRPEEHGAMTSAPGNAANSPDDRYFGSDRQYSEKRDTAESDRSGEPCRDVTVPDRHLNQQQMGAADSKHNGSNRPAQPPWRCSAEVEQKKKPDEFHDVPEVVCSYVLVEEEPPKSYTQKFRDFQTKESPDMSTSVVNGSLSLEISKFPEFEQAEARSFPPNGIERSLASTSLNIPIENKLKHILKEEHSFERPSSLRKHVTFQNFIEFDDGDHDDVVDDDSYASVDDAEEDSLFRMDVDNDQNGIVEFEDSSTSEDTSTAEELVKNATRENSALVIRELDAENDESIGFDYVNFNAPRIEEFEDKKEFIIKIEVEDALEIKEIATLTPKEAKIEVQLESSSEEEELEEEESYEDSVEESSEEDVRKNVPVTEKIEDPIKVHEEIVQKTVQVIVEKADVQQEESEEEEEVEEEEIEEEEIEEEEEEEEESNEEQVVECDKLADEDSFKNSRHLTQKLVNQWMTYKHSGDESNTAYTDLLQVIEKQMRGLVGQDERLADLQERAAALHRVQNEVCTARKEAELVRQKLWHVEGDLAATRCRNSELLEQLEARTEDAKAAENKIQELTDEAARLQALLDKLIPENEMLREKYKILKAERDEERRIIEETLALGEEERVARDEWWKQEFEKLRSQGAEREELLLADCEWKLREVQHSAREKGAMTEQRLRDLQRQADERCARADTQLAQMAELKTLQAEVHTLRQAGRDHARALRLANERASHAARAETEAGSLRALLDREKTAFASARAHYAKELEDKENRLIERLQEQADRLERELKNKYETEEEERRFKEQQESCKVHESIIQDAYDRLEMLKSTLAKKEAQYEENLQKEKSRADWELIELRRLVDKTEIKHSEALEKLEEEHAEEIERLNEETESKVKALETALTTQSVSARTTLELVKGQLKAEHHDTLQRLKEKHKTDMEKQWDIFVGDKEECLERMKAECIMEGQEEREKRDKELLQDIEVLKSDLASQEKSLSSLKVEARRATESRIIAERKLSDLQVAYDQREMAVRSEVTRQAEVAQREARETIEHLTKKCACLSNLFEDMRSRWQQAPGEAAQLRKALQDEKAKSAALRRQLDAMSRSRRGDEAGGEAEAGKSTADDTVRPPRRKRKKKRPESPAKTVYLPPVTVPVRIKQFNMNANKA